MVNIIILMARNNSSLVIDSLCGGTRKEGQAVAWLYCDYGARQEQTVINVIEAILRQLIDREISEEIGEKKLQKGARPLLKDLKRMLKIAIDPLAQVFICVDALDELVPGGLPALLGHLRDIVQDSPKIRVFLTGRPHVGKTVQKYFPEAVGIPINPNRGDIENYLKRRLGEDPLQNEMNDGLREDIVKTILDKMSNMCVRVSRLSTTHTY